MTRSVVFAAFFVLSALLLWPLPLHLGSHLPGDPAGDAGVYVWNLWVFQHELLDHGRLPVSTDHLFAFTEGADFALHNYTPLAGLIASPLVRPLGVVTTFNLVLMGAVALSGAAVFGLARRSGLGPHASAIAGAVFIAAPAITARETAHLSLVTTAALPLFQWRLMRLFETRRWPDAVTLGIVVALAAYSDAYFGIYCVLMGLFTTAWRFVRVETRRGAPRTVFARRSIAALDVLIAAMIAAVVVHLAGVHAVRLGPIRVGLEVLYTPMLVITLAAALRAALARPFILRFHDPDHHVPRLTRLGVVAVGTCLLLMVPPVIGVLQRMQQGRMPTSDIFWRSSPRGVDLLAYLVPNPVHPWFGPFTSRWFMPPREDAYPEFVAAFSLVALALLAVAARRRLLPRFWVAFTLFFGALSLGPFVHVAGINTQVPAPWAFLRFVPLLGMARAPSRFAILTTLGLAMLLGHAVDAWARHGALRTRFWVAAALVAIGLELGPAPRTLFSADVPDVYRILAEGDDSAAVLELPTGLRDGTSSMGDFRASTQYFQTLHERPLVGGYLSRVSEWRREESRRNPVLGALIALSEPGGGSVPPRVFQQARRRRDQFLSRSCVGFVVIDRGRASAALRSAAIDILRLVPVHEDERYELFQPDDPPPCRRRGAGRLRARNRRPVPHVP